MSSIATEAFFLQADPGSRFCLLYAPASGAPVRGAMLFVHAFAEEMNKSRRTVALAARALAGQGYAVLLLDLLGCGDGSGDFGDATWEAWRQDVVLGCRWLERRFGHRPGLWGLRLGCLLAVHAIPALGYSPNLLLWQPVMSGRAHLAQFLRLKAAAKMFGDADARTETKALRAQLERGESVEIAGYELSPSLALPMESAELALPERYEGSAWWCEVVEAADVPPGPASQSRIAAWRARGCNVEVVTVPGLPFWQTQEIAECMPLVEATVSAVAMVPA